MDFIHSLCPCAPAVVLLTCMAKEQDVDDIDHNHHGSVLLTSRCRMNGVPGPMASGYHIHRAKLSNASRRAEYEGHLKDLVFLLIMLTLQLTDVVVLSNIPKKILLQQRRRQYFKEKENVSSSGRLIQYDARERPNSPAESTLSVPDHTGTSHQGDYSFQIKRKHSRYIHGSQCSTEDGFGIDMGAHQGRTHVQALQSARPTKRFILSSICSRD